MNFNYNGAYFIPNKKSNIKKSENQNKKLKPIENKTSIKSNDILNELGKDLNENHENKTHEKSINTINQLNEKVTNKIIASKFCNKSEESEINTFPLINNLFTKEVSKNNTGYIQSFTNWIGSGVMNIGETQSHIFSSLKLFLGTLGNKDFLGKLGFDQKKHSIEKLREKLFQLAGENETLKCQLHEFDIILQYFILMATEIIKKNESQFLEILWKLIDLELSDSFAYSSRIKPFIRAVLYDTCHSILKADLEKNDGKKFSAKPFTVIVQHFVANYEHFYGIILEQQELINKTYQIDDSLTKEIEGIAYFQTLFPEGLEKVLNHYFPGNFSKVLKDKNVYKLIEQAIFKDLRPLFDKVTEILFLNKIELSKEEQEDKLSQQMTEIIVYSKDNTTIRRILGNFYMDVPICYSKLLIDNIMAMLSDSDKNLRLVIQRRFKIAIWKTTYLTLTNYKKIILKKIIQNNKEDRLDYDTLRKDFLKSLPLQFKNFHFHFFYPDLVHTWLLEIYNDSQQKQNIKLEKSLFASVLIDTFNKEIELIGSGKIEDTFIGREIIKPIKGLFPKVDAKEVENFVVALVQNYSKVLTPWFEQIAKGLEDQFLNSFYLYNKTQESFIGDLLNNIQSDLKKNISAGDQIENLKREINLEINELIASKSSTERYLLLEYLGIPEEFSKKLIPDRSAILNALKTVREQQDSNEDKKEFDKLIEKFLNRQWVVLHKIFTLEELKFLNSCIVDIEVLRNFLPLFQEHTPIDWFAEKNYLEERQAILNMLEKSKVDESIINCLKEDYTPITDTLQHWPNDFSFAKYDYRTVIRQLTYEDTIRFLNYIQMEPFLYNNISEKLNYLSKVSSIATQLHTFAPFKSLRRKMALLNITSQVSSEEERTLRIANHLFNTTQLTDNISKLFPTYFSNTANAFLKTLIINSLKPLMHHFEFFQLLVSKKEDKYGLLEEVFGCDKHDFSYFFKNIAKSIVSSLTGSSQSEWVINTIIQAFPEHKELFSLIAQDVKFMSKEGQQIITEYIEAFLIHVMRVSIENYKNSDKKQWLREFFSAVTQSIQAKDKPEEPLLSFLGVHSAKDLANYDIPEQFQEPLYSLTVQLIQNFHKRHLSFFPNEKSVTDVKQKVTALYGKKVVFILEQIVEGIISGKIHFFGNLNIPFQNTIITFLSIIGATKPNSLLEGFTHIQESIPQEFHQLIHSYTNYTVFNGVAQLINIKESRRVIGNSIVEGLTHGTYHYFSEEKPTDYKKRTLKELMAIFLPELVKSENYLLKVSEDKLKRELDLFNTPELSNLLKKFLTPATLKEIGITFLHAMTQSLSGNITESVYTKEEKQIHEKLGRQLLAFAEYGTASKAGSSLVYLIKKIKMQEKVAQVLGEKIQGLTSPKSGLVNQILEQQTFKLFNPEIALSGKELDKILQKESLLFIHALFNYPFKVLAHKIKTILESAAESLGISTKVIDDVSRLLYTLLKKLFIPQMYRFIMKSALDVVLHVISKAAKIKSPKSVDTLLSDAMNKMNPKTLTPFVEAFEKGINQLADHIEKQKKEEKESIDLEKEIERLDIKIDENQIVIE